MPQEPPKALLVIPEQIPQELRSIDRWLIWRYESGSNGAWKKVPYRATEPTRRAAVNDENSWASFDEAVNAYRVKGASGIGIVLTDDGLVGLDLDHVRNGPKKFHSSVSELRGWGTYLEISPSGNGVRGFGYARLPGASLRHVLHETFGDNTQKVGVELYGAGHFLSVTGRRLSAADVVDVQEPAERLWNKLKTLRAERKAAQQSSDPSNAGGERPRRKAYSALDAAALAHLDDWVPVLFPKARKYHNGYRVSSKDLGRPSLQEDLQLLPEGIMDFGLERGLTPLGVLTSILGMSPKEAARRLGELLEVKAGARQEEPESDDGAFGEAACDLLPDPPPKQQPAPIDLALAAPGVLGDYVRLVLEHSEVSAEALIPQLLTVLSAVVDGAGVHLGSPRPVGAGLMTFVVGSSARSRKGTAASFAHELLRTAFPVFYRGTTDPVMVEPRVLPSLQSGEGLLERIRDPQGEDAGCADKRLYIHLEEASLLLDVSKREGNTLSAHLRSAFDGVDLASPGRAKNRNYLRASEPHIGLVAMCTPDELGARLDSGAFLNGLLNRFLTFWAPAREVRACPPLPRERLAAVAGTVRRRLELWTRERIRDRRVLVIGLTEAAQSLYLEARKGMHNEDSELLNAAMGRFPTYALKLALLLCLLERDWVADMPQIGESHMRGALELLRYARESLLHVHGWRGYESPVQNAIARILQGAEGAWISRTELFAKTQRHLTAEQIDEAIDELLRLHRVQGRIERRPGRPARSYRWLGE